ncbi:MAG: endonuclease III [Candidatus Dadabacteria bacterium]|nr:MAG: endonuclease III [Candidatus Dadabacteria bacterium]
MKKKQLIKTFSKLYPNPRSELVFKNNYQLLVCVMLSAQCTDKKVNQVTPELFSRYPDFNSLARARQKTLERIVRPINYYRTKAANLIKTAKIIVKEHKGRVPREAKSLTALPGVGNKTAAVVLNEMGVEPTFPVDTHVFRVSKRLGLASGKTTDQVSEELKKAFSPKDWRNLHHWLILHGRRVCKARNPLCSECSLKRLCRHYESTH